MGFELPEQLYTGDVICSKKTVATIHRTSKKNEFGERLYRLRFKTGVLGTTRYTRDELAAEDCSLVYRPDKKKKGTNNADHKCENA